MEYRRFGKTEKKLSVITLGGMRFKHGWDDPRREIPEDTQEQCTQLIDLAIKHGINHFETAYGYKKSETAYGHAFKQLKIKRDSYYLMTKGTAETASEIRKLVEEQLNDLQTDYFDFYGWHGINNDEMLKSSCSKGGSIEELLKMKEEGIIKHVGFSTHGPLETIIRTIETDLFDFVNLHYYYFNQRNEAAIALAQNKDMGVFIISPNDKGGQLYNASQKVKKTIPHATPIQWNSRFCLSNPSVHTLSFGITEAAHFDEMQGIFPVSIPLVKDDEMARLNLDRLIIDDEYANYNGYDLDNDVSGINIPEILRLRKLWKCYDMLEFAKYRYKELKTPNHWFPGVYATDEKINQIDQSKVPSNIPLKELLKECHSAFYETPEQLPTKIDVNQLKIAPNE